MRTIEEEQDGLILKIADGPTDINEDNNSNSGETAD